MNADWDLAAKYHEAVTRADTAERNAEVLAKAVDRLFADGASYHLSQLSRRVRELREEVQPTLQALGYGKGETA